MKTINVEQTECCGLYMAYDFRYDKQAVKFNTSFLREIRYGIEDENEEGDICIFSFYFILNENQYRLYKKLLEELKYPEPTVFYNPNTGHTCYHYLVVV